MLPKGLHLELFDLEGIPPYNDDVASSEPPIEVNTFREKISSADGLLISSTEYNYSISGVLKNAIDWASTNTLGNVMDGKAVGIMGASSTYFGTTHSQRHLRQVLHAVNAKTLGKPEVFLPKAGESININGELENERVLNKIKTLMVELQKMILHP